MKVIIDNTSKEWVLGIFDKSVDSDGFITEMNGTRVWTPEGEEIKAKDLAMIKKGSTKFISNDLPSLLKETNGEM